MRIFLADLGHNQVTISSDVFPLGVANLAAYTNAYLNAKKKVQIELFRDPNALKAALDDSPPDVLGLSSYAWNHELAMQFAEYAKMARPDMLTLVGGPNFPLTVEEQESYLRTLTHIDAAVRGPTYEGERAFLNLVRRFDEVGMSIEGLQEEAVPGNLWINRRSGEFMRGGDVERIRDLDEIPSPYLTGLMDPYFDTGLFPLLQMSRGCPFSCSFCNSSVRSNSKIYSHSVENVKADLLYVAERIRPEVPLCFADDNFGMYAMDEEVADYIAHLQQRYNWPQYIRTTTGKNKHDRIIRVMRKTGGILPMTAAVQSLNPDVLNNINRSNIKLSTYAEIQKELQAQGMQSYGELILSMPGETKQSFMKAVESLLDSGTKRISAHQLMLLHGAPLNNPESRERWQFLTRFRVVARNIGHYLDEPTVEVEEIVVETPTFSFEEYLEARVFHLLLTIYFYEGNYEEVFEFAWQNGLKPYDLLVRIYDSLDTAPEGMKQLIGDFVRESQEELFDSKEACIAWSRENFAGLIDGTIGGNLLSKYAMIGRFYATHDALNLLERAVQESLTDRLSAENRTVQDSIFAYLRASLLHVPFATTLEADPTFVSRFDVDAWRQSGYSPKLEEYLFDAPREFATVVEPTKKALIQSRVTTFGEHPAGLGKFTRTMFAQDLRRSLVSASPVSLDE